LSSARRKLGGSNLNITDGYFIFASDDGEGEGFYKRVNASTDITSAFTSKERKKKERMVGAAAKGNSVSVDDLFTPV